MEPYGSFARPAAQLREMLAQSAEFQRLTGTDSPAQSLARIHLANALETQPRPHAVVCLGVAHTLQLAHGGEQNWLLPSGSLQLYLAADTPAEYLADYIQAELWAGSVFGRIVDDLAALAGADNPGGELCHLPLRSLTLLAMEESPEEEWQSLGRFWWSAWECAWSAHE